MNYNFINLLSGFICLTENITKQRNNRIGNEHEIPMPSEERKKIKMHQLQQQQWQRR